jgi:hypothetical protein
MLDPIELNALSLTDAQDLGEARVNGEFPIPWIGPVRRRFWQKRQINPVMPTPEWRRSAAASPAREGTRLGGQVTPLLT